MSSQPFRLGVKNVYIDGIDVSSPGEEMKIQKGTPSINIQNSNSMNTAVEEFLDPRGLHNIKNIVKQVLFEAGVYKSTGVVTASTLPLISFILPTPAKD